MALNPLNPEQLASLLPFHRQELTWRTAQFLMQTGLPSHLFQPQPAQLEAAACCYTWVCRQICKHVLGDLLAMELPALIAEALRKGARPLWFEQAHHWFEGLQFDLPLQSATRQPDLLPMALASGRAWACQPAIDYPHFAANQWPINHHGLQGELVLEDEWSGLPLQARHVSAIVFDDGTQQAQAWPTLPAIEQMISRHVASLPPSPWVMPPRPVLAQFQWGGQSHGSTGMVRQVDLIDVRLGRYKADIQSPLIDSTCLHHGVSTAWQDSAHPPCIQAGFLNATLDLSWGWGDPFVHRHAERFGVQCLGHLALDASTWQWQGEWRLDQSCIQFDVRPSSSASWELALQDSLDAAKLLSQPELLSWTAELPVLVNKVSPVEVGRAVLVPLAASGGKVTVRIALQYQPELQQMVFTCDLNLSALQASWLSHHPNGLQQEQHQIWSEEKILWTHEVRHG